MRNHREPRRRRRGRQGAGGGADLVASARQREIDRQLRVWTPRRILGWTVGGIAVVVPVVHWIAHLGYPVLPLSLGWQDVLLGYPVAALLGVTAAIILGSGPPFSRTGPRRPRP